MGRQLSKRDAMGAALALLLWALAGCAALRTPAAPAVLTGKVSVGPLSPVERVPPPGQTPTPVAAQVYTSRALNIYRADGKTLVKSVPFQGDGTYRVELRPGTYVLALPPRGIEHARGLPRAVTLKAGETLQVDIAIDTGIR